MEATLGFAVLGLTTWLCRHKNGAENETRTRDPHLGKVMLYQLSYFRIMKLEATLRIELRIEDLQSSALPLGYVAIIWSGKRDSNSRPPPWQGDALPTELFPQWRPEGDLNP